MHPLFKISLVPNFVNISCDSLRLSCRNCPRGWAWGRSTCHTGAGRTSLHSLTPLCSGCPVSPMTQASVLTWRELRCLASGPIPAPPTQTASFVRNQSVSPYSILLFPLFHWKWAHIHKQSLFTNLIHIFSSAVSPNQNARPCKMPCSLRTTCENCTSQAMECMWCGSTKRCVDSNAYVISFPYGQCLEWQTADCVCECPYLHIVAISHDEKSVFYFFFQHWFSGEKQRSTVKFVKCTSNNSTCTIIGSTM